MFKIVIVLLVLALGIGGVLFFQKNVRDAHTRDKEKSAGPSLVAPLNAENFDAEIAKRKGVVLVDFSATWCGPCRMMAPVLEELAAEYAGRASFANVDLDASPALAKRFKVSGIPLLVLLKDGNAVDQKVGVAPKDELKTWIDAALAAH